MQLKLTKSLKAKVKAIAVSLLFDVLDGDIDEVAALIEGLRVLADELEAQNAR